MFKPNSPPTVPQEQTELLRFVQAEFQALVESLNSLDNIRLKMLYSAPTKVYVGLTVLADGTQWNPGAGQGVYTYYASGWHKLG